MSSENRLMLLQDRHLPQPCAADLCAASPSVSSADTNATVLDLFTRHADLANLPVVAEQRPIGMVKRHVFLSELAKPFHKEVYERKSCVAFMDHEPLIVDATATIQEISFAIVESGGKALTDGFLIVRDGRFIGVGSGLDLMRMVANQQAEKNRQIMQSIDYASVIQRAMLRPSHETLFGTLRDVGLAWQPRDVIGGDFYHFAAYPDGWFLALADCTGHGVPGAFMTLISSSWLARTLERIGPRDPAALLAELNRSVKTSLAQTESRGNFDTSDDGLDALMLWFDPAQTTLTFASARIPLHVLVPGDDTVRTLEGDRMGLGYVDTPMTHTWTNRSVPLAHGSIVCATTDGMVDQIGGPKHIAFGKRRVREAMLQARALPMRDFATALLDTHADYQAGHSRRDDLTLFCFRAESTPAR
jgi:serine phosphatase RsbU (regulator of sigma subunit)